MVDQPPDRRGGQAGFPGDFADLHGQDARRIVAFVVAHDRLRRLQSLSSITFFAQRSSASGADENLFSTLATCRWSRKFSLSMMCQTPNAASFHHAPSARAPSPFLRCRGLRGLRDSPASLRAFLRSAASCAAGDVRMCSSAVVRDNSGPPSRTTRAMTNSTASLPIGFSLSACGAPAMASCTMKAGYDASQVPVGAAPLPQLAHGHGHWLLPHSKRSRGEEGNSPGSNPQSSSSSNSSMIAPSRPRSACSSAIFRSNSCLGMCRRMASSTS